jgi:hypothetical protein
MFQMKSQLTNIYISPESNYWKHKMGTPGTAPTHEPETIEVHAGRGLVGDRFYDYKENYNGQVSFKWLKDNVKGGLRAKALTSGHIKLGDSIVII